MVDTIYIEESIRSLPRTKKIVARYPKARQIVIEKYAQVFNPKTQNFRLQKQNPSLILAAKQGNKVLSAPYETGGVNNYYFSHMLNCIYDCRYCFLQGMYRSANYLVFVNYQEFLQEINEIALSHASEPHADESSPTWFFSGYDCDSLAYEPVTGFAEYFVSGFKSVRNAVLELRTKSTQIRSLLDIPAQDNVMIAYSLSPEEVVDSVEKGTPSLQKRLDAIVQLQQHGWRIGLRFDPVIWHQDYQVHYQAMIRQVFTQLNIKQIENVTIGGFRLPKGYYKTMRKLYPQHWLFSVGLTEQQGMVTYRQSIEQAILDTVAELCRDYIEDEQIYQYSNFGAQ